MSSDFWVTQADEQSSNTRLECTIVLEKSPHWTYNIRFKSRLRTGILIHERRDHEKKTDLYGVLLLYITAVQQSLHNLLTAYHTVADEEARAGDVVQKTRILSDPLALLGAPWVSLSSSSSLHDAPRQPIPPSFQWPQVVLDDMPSSWHGVFKAGLVSEGQRIDRYIRRNILPVPFSCRLMVQSLTLQKTMQPHPNLTWISPRSIARHDPKNGQAWKQTHYPIVHEAFGSCPSRFFIRWQAGYVRNKASGTTLMMACLSPLFLTVGCNQSSPTAFSASVKEWLYAR